MKSNPLSIVYGLYRQKDLIKQITYREVISRYKGSYLGIVWSFLNPLIMLLIYTFVFGVVFKSRWGQGSGSKTEFALILFCGLITFNLFSEIISRAPTIILSNVNYVKKVVFPLEILPVTIVGSALVHMFISLIVLVISIMILTGNIHWTLIFVPVALIPLVLFSLGLGWFLASIGVYIRDIGHIITLFIQALLFLSPVFYPVSSIPFYLQTIFYINPISYVVEDMRNIVVWGQYPDWKWLFLGTIIGFIICLLGYIWFQRTRRGFPDVL